MKYLKAAVLLAMAWLIVEAALTVRAGRRAVEEATTLLDWHAEQVRLAADARLGDAIIIFDARLADIERRADQRIAEAVNRADARIGETLVRTDARLADVLAEVRVLRAEAQRTLAEVRGIVEDARPGVQAWSTMSPHLAANALGAVAALKATAGQAAQTMREIERASPDIVAAIEASASASQQAAQSAAQTGQNLAEITRPGPRWLRYLGLGLSVAAPAAQVALPFAIQRLDAK